MHLRAMCACRAKQGSSAYNVEPAAYLGVQQPCTTPVLPEQQQLWTSQGHVSSCISALHAKVSDSCPAAERQPE